MALLGRTAEHTASGHCLLPHMALLSTALMETRVHSSIQTRFPIHLLPQAVMEEQASLAAKAVAVLTDLQGRPELLTQELGVEAVGAQELLLRHLQVVAVVPVDMWRLT